MVERYDQAKPDNGEKRNRFCADRRELAVDIDEMARDFVRTFDFIYGYQTSRVRKQISKIEEIFTVNPICFNEDHTLALIE